MMKLFRRPAAEPAVVQSVAWKVPANTKQDMDEAGPGNDMAATDDAAGGGAAGNGVEAIGGGAGG